MAAIKQLLLFGDQTVHILGAVKDIYSVAKQSVLLPILIQRSEDALVSEISKFPLTTRLRFYHARSMLTLAEEYTKHKQIDAGVSTVLSCFVQLAFLFMYTEKHPSQPDIIPSNDLIVVGSCTGLIVGAVAATVSSVGQILDLVPEIIRLGLRLGLEIDQRSMQFERCRESWATAVSGVQGLYFARKPYISAIADSTTVTISGMPTILKQLWESSHVLRDAVYVELPIAAAFHTRHMGAIDVEKMIGNGAVFRKFSTKQATILSPSLAAPYESRDLEQLLRSAINDIAHERIDWASTVNNLPKLLGSQVIITSIGPNNVAKKLIKSLESSSIEVQNNVELQITEDHSFERGSPGDIAVVGMSGRFPGAETLDSFWQLLVDGLDKHQKIPADRFDLDSHFDASGATKNTIVTPYGCFIERPGMFDTRLFSMSPREAAQTDPGQRLMLLTAYEALEMAGYTANGSPSTDSSRIGTFFGQTTDDWREHNASQNIDIYYATAGIRAFGPGRLNYHFKWDGPSYSVDTACSSSSVAIQLACQSLLSRECDMAVAGGANILTGSDMFAGLGRGGFLSPSGACKTFDKDADGYCRADGVGTIILKRLEDALNERDNIQAIIRSVSTNHSAQASSITHPHAETQGKLFRKILTDAAVEPHCVDYIECHGTGTQAGDAAEYTSVSGVFGNDPVREKPLYISSVKGNIGHSEAAAGVTSLIKAAMMFRNNLIPPHVGVTTGINPKLSSIGKDKIHIPFQATPLGSAKKDNIKQKRAILLNNFSAAGGNTSLILQDGLHTRREGSDTRNCHVVTISGHTDTSFQQNLKQLSQWLNVNGDVRVSDLGYTTTARRAHHSRRISYAVSSVEELKDMLSNKCDPDAIKTTPRVGFVFTGQGSQYLGMGKDLLDISKYFRDLLLEMNKLCLSQSFPSIMDIFTAEPSSLLPIQLQLGSACLDIALAKLWQSWGLQPDVVVGHSLGEYAALCFASVISISDMIFLVGQRALLMQEKCVPNTHSMLTVRASSKEVMRAMKLIHSECEIACVNGPHSVVVSGNIDDINLLHELLEEQNVKSMNLPIQYAFHSKQLDPILADLAHLAEHIDFKKPEIPIASTLTGDLVCEQGVFGPRYSANQTRQPVDFFGAIAAWTASCPATETFWVECGPGGACASMIGSIVGTRDVRAFASFKKTEDSWKTITNTIAKLHDAGANIQWREFHKPYEKSLLLLDLPTYAFDLQNYWLQYEGNWSITKNTLQQEVVGPLQGFSSGCLHRIASEKFDETSGSLLTATFVSDLSEPTLNAMARGHLVCGVALVPSSVYAEMAYSAASYFHSRERTYKGEVPGFDLSEMEIYRPLVAPLDGASQLVTIFASKKVGSSSVSLAFASLDSGGKSNQHATCTVKSGDGEVWMDEWLQVSSLVEDRVQQLKHLAEIGDSSLILRKMVYKLFTAVVNYDEKYHSLDKVFLHQERHEAAANITFKTAWADNGVTFNPYWIDCLAQMGGFVLNSSPSTSPDTVYISTGWKSMRIVKKLEQEKLYQAYVHMKPTRTDGLLSGDVYFFDGPQVIGLCQGLKFRNIKLSLLRSVLGIKQSSSLPLDYHQPIAKQQSMATSSPALVAKNSGTNTPIQVSFDNILGIIGTETGAQINEIAGDSALEDLGIDSLLTMSILSKLREATGLELPNSLFNMYPTISALRSFFEGQFIGGFDTSPSTPSSYPATDVSITLPTTPAPFDGDIILQVIAGELGIEISKMDSYTSLNDLGLDSLMSIAIIGHLREKTGLPLSSSFFNDNTCMSKVLQALEIPTTTSISASSTSQLLSNSKISPLAESELRSTSFLLQGSPNPNKPALFLLPDGSGSALSYINLPTFVSRTTVYALFSPFLSTPSVSCIPFTLSLPQISSIYLSEILRLQPRGPYHIAGWSMGGIYAYEVCSQLLSLGHVVDSLTLIDSPCPGFLPPLPSATLSLLEDAGLFSGQNKTVSEATRQHFVESVRVLSSYSPTPLPAASCLKRVVIIWAEDGVGAHSSSAMPKNQGVGMAREWLMEKRTEFGPNGWDKLLCSCSLKTYSVPGNHFSIMNAVEVKAVAEILDSIMRDI
ncbi:Conidial pigment polyketide synthase [Lachnellula hyalina]|uniref:Conidial pigment polyketide synthase n=1 Tax=Lachnellula hyalina TaxID=1316788 RepID=A0A8H8R4W5_9HELO|nr:Conidial pigment polyketide synthase [Lachnellula hyalina]TVY28403.1 Conidial pigment polyketide synthase [Lachnellula hyalina]